MVKYTERITTRLSEEQVQKIDELVEQGPYESRSDVIRYAIMHKYLTSVVGYEPDDILRMALREYIQKENEKLLLGEINDKKQW